MAFLSASDKAGDLTVTPNLATCQSNQFKGSCPTYYLDLKKDDSMKKYNNYIYVYVYLFYIYTCIFCRIFLSLVYYFDIVYTRTQAKATRVSAPNIVLYDSEKYCQLEKYRCGEKRLKKDLYYENCTSNEYLML